MRVQFYGGPRDGEQTNVNPKDTDVERFLVAVDTKDGGFITKHYWLDVRRAIYLWEDLTWPPDKK